MFVVTWNATWYGEPFELARSPPWATGTPLSAGCVGLMIGFDTAHVGTEQSTVTLAFVVASTQGIVDGNWIERFVLPDEASWTLANVTVPPEAVAVSSSEAPPKSWTLVPSGADVEMTTSYWKPSTHWSPLLSSAAESCA